MIKSKVVVKCDVCGHIEEAVEIAEDNKEAKHSAPRGWGKVVNGNDVDICPDCMRKLKPGGIGISRPTL